MVLQLPHEPLTRRASLIILIKLTGAKRLQASDPHKRVEGIAKRDIDVIAQGTRIHLTAGRAEPNHGLTPPSRFPVADNEFAARRGRPVHRASTHR
jgi:hypothetical protein